MITECEFSWRPYVKAISSWTLSVLLNVSISIFSFFFKNVILLKHSWFISFCSKAKWFSYTDICYFSDSFPLSLITGYWAYSRASLFIHPICYCSGTQSYPALATMGTAAHQAALSFTVSQSFLKLMPIESTLYVLTNSLYLLILNSQSIPLRLSFPVATTSLFSMPVSLFLIHG